MLKEVKVPDIGSYSGVSIIEILVSPGQKISKEASLITLETEKATMEIPSPYAGVVKSLNIKLGDTVSAGDLILSIETEDEKGEKKEESKTGAVEQKADQKPISDLKEKPSEVKAQGKDQEKERGKEPEKKKEMAAPRALDLSATVRQEAQALSQTPQSFASIHAGPGVRRFARELGVDLSRVSGNGKKNRILIEDVRAYVKQELSRISAGGLAGAPIAGAGGGR